jgi:hypothetical protein
MDSALIAILEDVVRRPFRVTFTPKPGSSVSQTKMSEEPELIASMLRFVSLAFIVHSLRS